MPKITPQDVSMCTIAPPQSNTNPNVSTCTCTPLTLILTLTLTLTPPFTHPEPNSNPNPNVSIYTPESLELRAALYTLTYGNLYTHY